MLSDNLFALNHKDNLLNSSIVISINGRIFVKYVGVICKRCEFNSTGRELNI